MAGQPIAPRFAGLPQFEKCLVGGRMTPDGFDLNGDLIVDEPNDAFTVAAIQSALKALHYPILVTFVYDDATATLVKQFKEDQNLAIPAGMVAHDGVTGPGTSKRLNEIFTPQPVPASPPIPPPPPPALQDWVELISFRPPVPMQLGLNGRFQIAGFPTRVIHSIEDAYGPVNLDYFPIRIEALPLKGGVSMTADELLEEIRRNINNFVDGAPQGCQFSPYDAAIDGPAWAPLFLPTGFPGAVMSIDMWVGLPGPLAPLGNLEDGSVVLSEITHNHWTFSTLWTPDDRSHPVSGNRRFGYEILSAGEYMFYTRGADRTTTALDNQISTTVFGAAEHLWRSFQRRVAAFVNANGGIAHIEPADSHRYHWGPAIQELHHPVVEWAQ